MIDTCTIQTTRTQNVYTMLLPVVTTSRPLSPHSLFKFGFYHPIKLFIRSEPSSDNHFWENSHVNYRYRAKDNWVERSTCWVSKKARVKVSGPTCSQWPICLLSKLISVNFPGFILANTKLLFFHSQMT